MKYELTPKDKIFYQLKIVGEPEEIKKEIDQIAKEIRKTAKLPGFRPGKAPLNIIKRHFGDEIRDALIRTYLSRKIAEVLQKEGIQILTDPIIEDLKFNPETGEFEVLLILETKPQIELKREDYAGIKVKKSARSVEDKDVERVIEGLRNQLAQWKETDREAKEGDLVEIEYETEIEGQEEVHKGSVAVVLGQKQLWPEVEKEVVGKRAGEEGEVEFAAGEDKEIYGEAAGKKLKVRFKVKAVKEKELPEVNDEFAKRLGFENLEEMRKKIRDDLEIAEKTREQEEIEDQIIEELLKKVDVPVPPSLLDLELRAQAENQLRRLAQMGIDISQVSPQSVLEMVKPTAEKTVKVKLLLEKVADLEGIEVSDEDIDQEIQKIADNIFGGDYVKARQSLEERNLLPMIREDVRRQKALDRLIELAQIEEVEEKESQE